MNIRKSLPLIIFFCSLASMSYGQLTITGKVIDELGSLPGVNIVVYGT